MIKLSEKLSVEIERKALARSSACSPEFAINVSFNIAGTGYDPDLDFYVLCDCCKLPNERPDAIRYFIDLGFLSIPAVGEQLSTKSGT
jgi:hypothetical protein